MHVVRLSCSAKPLSPAPGLHARFVNTSQKKKYNKVRLINSFYTGKRLSPGVIVCTDAEKRGKLPGRHLFLYICAPAGEENCRNGIIPYICAYARQKVLNIYAYVRQKVLKTTGSDFISINICTRRCCRHVMKIVSFEVFRRLTCQ